MKSDRAISQLILTPAASCQTLLTQQIIIVPFIQVIYSYVAIVNLLTLSLIIQVVGCTVYIYNMYNNV